MKEAKVKANCVHLKWNGAIESVHGKRVDRLRPGKSRNPVRDEQARYLTSITTPCAMDATISRHYSPVYHHLLQFIASNREETHYRSFSSSWITQQDTYTQ